jgi:hypothetical protein
MFARASQALLAFLALGKLETFPLRSWRFESFLLAVVCMRRIAHEQRTQVEHKYKSFAIRHASEQCNAICIR